MKESKRIAKPIRTLSGVTPVTILTKPYACPGRCTFCPTEVDMPKSYLSKEPAAQRAKTAKFHPKTQIENRLSLYKKNNHPTDKIELIILGGTWSYYPKRYQSWFIKNCYDTLNNKKSKSLKEAQKLNENSKRRMIGLTIETRPDYINEKEIYRLRKMGVTRIELGAQTVFNDVLKKNLRDHNVDQTISATKLLKEAGFKINYHIMPNLPFSDKKKDLEVFRILFSNSQFQPDMLKIYPCVLLENTVAYKWYQQGKYFPYKTNELIDLAVKFKKYIPPYVRIMRLFRDIPKDYVLAGSTTSNLRQLIHQEMKQKGMSCQCIRCREIRNLPQQKELILNRINYNASDGQEIFLQFIDSKNKIYGFLRLRKNNKDTETPFSVLQNSTIIRELHVYGRSAPIDKLGKIQHKGLGKKLIEKAEKITKEEFGFSKISVISGIGVRPYYKKLGYNLNQTYMVKYL